MPSPTIVLVHGAFADASSWRPVYDRLAGDGHAVLAPPNPLRGSPYDASFTASIIDQIEGPVVLVGHSYGGAVITVAGSSDKVAGLVYVASVVPVSAGSPHEKQCISADTRSRGSAPWQAARPKALRGHEGYTRA